MGMINYIHGQVIDYLRFIHELKPVLLCSEAGEETYICNHVRTNYRAVNAYLLRIHSLVEKPFLVGRPNSTIVPVLLKTGTKNDF